MMSSQKQNVSGQMLFIVILSIVLAFVYNSFSAKPLSMIRVEPVKIAVDDSLLFSQPEIMIDSIANAQPESKDTTQQRIDGRMKKLAGSPEEDIKNNIYKVVSMSQVKRLLADGEALFIDARDEESYRKGHIQGAINIFGDEPDQHFEIIAPLPRDTLTVIYCNGPDCHLARALAEFMRILEFTNLYLYDDGWEGWQQAKMPEEKSQ